MTKYKSGIMDYKKSTFSIDTGTRFLEETDPNGLEWVHTLDQINSNPYLLKIYKELVTLIR